MQEDGEQNLPPSPAGRGRGLIPLLLPFFYEAIHIPHMYVGDSNAVRGMKDAVSELGHLPTFTNRRRGHFRSVAVRLPAMALHKSQMGGGPLNVAFGQPRVGVTDDAVNVLWHFLGNRKVPAFWKCDAHYK